ncbi:unnamed protein product [Caenorhabditis sp. 36 PRJEB53466]|nr:unnamed protein product [Caenorhabditis sp. 36 PRJEB53466]
MGATTDWNLNGTELLRIRTPIRLSLDSTDGHVDHLDEARARLATIDFTATSPVETPTAERRMDIQMSEEHEKLMDEMRNGRVPMGATVFEPSPEILAPSAPAPLQVRFQEPDVPAQAPPTSAIAPRAPEVPVPVEAPPPPAPQTSNISSLMKDLLGQQNAESDSDSDNPPKPAVSQKKSAYDEMMSQMRGTFSVDDDDEPKFTAKPKQSAMFGNDDEDDDFFNFS